MIKFIKNWYRVRQLEKSIQILLKAENPNIPLINSFRAEVSILSGDFAQIEADEHRAFEAWQKSINFAKELEEQVKKTTDQFFSLSNIMAAINGMANPVVSEPEKNETK